MMSGVKWPRLVWLCVLWLACAGCEDDFASVTSITDMRILGARIETVEDPERSTPRPGETAEVQLALARPRTRSKRELRAMFIHCTYPERFTGIPICQELLDALAEDVDLSLGRSVGEGELIIRCEEDRMQSQAGVGLTCLSDDLTLTVPVAADFTGRAMLYRGVVCAGGTPFFDPFKRELFGCDGGRKTVLTHGSIPVSVGEEEDNRNPMVGDVGVTVNGRDWPALEPEAEGELDDIATDCMGLAEELGLKDLDPFEHRIGLEVADDAREQTVEGPETFELSIYATAGELEPRFTLFDEDAQVEEGILAGDVRWLNEGVDVLNEAGEVVDFYITVRDQRGGFALVRRSACIRAGKVRTGSAI